MPTINDNFLNLKAGYLFPEIGRRVREFQAAHPDAPVIKMGIGDVTEPLPPACVEAMHKAVDDQANRETFHGYGPEKGYAWLREKIATFDYINRGCTVDPEEIFISDASKCDAANILDILKAGGNRVAVTDPVYPVYVDTNVMAGNGGASDDPTEYSGLTYLRATAENNFSPEIPNEPVDVIYLCYPNNPTGAVISKDRLSEWVSYAKANNAVIMYDAAYEAYIVEPDVPRSIYEIEGARECAIEFRSFSKNAGFTGTRCAFTVVPRGLMGKSSSGEDVDLHQLWHRRQSTKFNSVSYIVQRGAEAVYSPEGQEQVAGLVHFYLENALLLRQALSDLGFKIFGGVNAPYIWLQTKDHASSWDFFDLMLSECHLVGTPGSGFGKSGEGYFRLSAFNSRANIEEAISRLQKRFG